MIARDAKRDNRASRGVDLTLEADRSKIARLRTGWSRPHARRDGGLDMTTAFHAGGAVASLAIGFSEASLQFLSAHELDAFDTRRTASRAVLPNPVSADYGVLRDSLLPQLAGSLGRNASRQVESAALFEMGRVFFKDADGACGEEERVSLGMMGPFGRSAVDRRRAVTNEEAMLWLKGAVENLAAAMHAGELAFERGEHPAME